MLKFLKYQIVIVVIAAIVGLFIWDYVKSKPDREYNRQQIMLKKFADKQELEIKIVEQASKLSRYKLQMETAKLEAEKAAKVADPNK